MAPFHQLIPAHTRDSYLELMSPCLAPALSFPLPLSILLLCLCFLSLSIFTLFMAAIKSSLMTHFAMIITFPAASYKQSHLAPLLPVPTSITQCSPPVLSYTHTHSDKLN